MADNDSAKNFDRIADAVDRIAAAVHDLVTMAGTPHQRTTSLQQDKYLSGQWHRRDGTVYGTAQTRTAAPDTPLDPQLRRDVPNVEARQGQTGIN